MSVEMTLVIETAIHGNLACGCIACFQQVTGDPDPDLADIVHGRNTKVAGELSLQLTHGKVDQLGQIRNFQRVLVVLRHMGDDLHQSTVAVDLGGEVLVRTLDTGDANHFSSLAQQWNLAAQVHLGDALLPWHEPHLIGQWGRRGNDALVFVDILSRDRRWKKIEVGTADQLLGVRHTDHFTDDAIGAHKAAIGVLDVHVDAGKFVEQIEQTADLAETFEELTSPV